MKAFIQHNYGPPDTLEFQDVATPAVGDDQVLVRVRAASVNPLDWHEVTGTPYIVRTQGGLRRPKQLIPGTDMAGQVEAVGKDVTRFRVGDEVFGMCAGAFAEFVSVRERKLARKPAAVSFEQAAAVPVAALTALQALRDRGRLQAGHRVLINGASGGVGTFAVQIAKALGAEVTGVCSTRNVEMVRKLGADHVVDYTQEDFTRSPNRYDLILDIAGTRTIRDRRRTLAPHGILVAVGGPKKNRWIGPGGAILRMLVVSRFSNRKMVAILAKNSREDMEVLQALLEAGKLTPVVERTFPLREVPDALREVGAGHSRGKLVISGT